MLPLYYLPEQLLDLLKDNALAVKMLAWLPPQSLNRTYPISGSPFWTLSLFNWSISQATACIWIKIMDKQEDITRRHSKESRNRYNHYYTSMKSCRGYFFTAVCRWANLDVVFVKWLLTALARTLSKLLILGQRSRSQWHNIHFSS